MRTIPVLAALAAGCTWVTEDDFLDRLEFVDDDQDGYTAAQGDCDETNAAISPSMDESWYDGVDSDCAGDDDYDADKDGYVPTEYAGLVTQEAPGTGFLPSGDCDDNEARAYPNGSDVWYDGIDGDCAGDNDFDQDGDGYVPTNYGNAAGLPEGDCDDKEANVNPDQVDTWYDGIDKNCGGDDDYDADGDRFVPEGFLGATTLYVPGSGALPSGDCNDHAAAINPGIVDAWYDGVDSDCGGENDHDQDEDGVLHPRGGGEDCDDTDPTTYPGALEQLSDATDHDCDGSTSGFRADSFEGYSWVGPSDATFGENSSFLYMSVTALRIDAPSDTWYDSAIALAFDADRPQDGIFTIIDWRVSIIDPAYDITPGHDFIVTDDYMFGVVGLQLSGGRTLRMGGYDFTTGNKFGVNYSVTSGELSDFEDSSLVRDEDGALHAVACESVNSIGQYVYATEDSILASQYDYSGLLEDWTARTCQAWIDDRSPVVRVASGNGNSLVESEIELVSGEPVHTIVEYVPTYDPLEIDSVAYDGETWVVFADAFNDGIVVLSPDGTETLIDTERDPYRAQVAVDRIGDLYIAYIDGTGDVWLAIGHPESSFDVTPVTAEFSVDQVGIWVTEESELIVVALLGANELAVGVADRW